jgi:DNA-binding transcriptional MerR regulator
MNTGRRELLTIGEAAGLVGVTPKAIRHYHKLGLLGEPERSEAGYRLYGAEDLLRLRRIRRLRDLGLSLAQVRQVLGEPEGEPRLRAVLEALLSEVEAEMGRLKERKGRIEALLAREDLDALGAGDPEGPSPTYERVKEILGHRLADIDPEILEQEERLFAALDSYAWPSDPAEPYEALARYYADHPEAYATLVRIGERLAALADAPEDSPEIERLAADAVRFYGENPLPKELPEAPEWAEGPLGLIFSEVMLAELSPAQRRWAELVRERTEEDR